jgi:hypothetical protein
MSRVFILVKQSFLVTMGFYELLWVTRRGGLVTGLVSGGSQVQVQYIGNTDGSRHG